MKAVLVVASCAILFACGDGGQSEEARVRKGVGAVRELPPRLAHHIGTAEAIRELAPILAPDGGLREGPSASRRGSDYRNFEFSGGTVELDTDGQGNLYSARIILGAEGRCPPPSAGTISALTALFAPGGDQDAADRAAREISEAIAAGRPAAPEIPGLQVRLDDVCPVEIRLDPRATGGFGKWVSVQRP